MSLRVLALTKYSRTGVSSRQRFLQFIPGLRERGIDVDVAPLWDDVHLSRLFRGQLPDPRSELAAYARRIRRLRSLVGFDVVWLEGELFPFVPALAEARLSARLPLVVDYDDAVFHKYDLHRRRLVRGALGRKIDDVMRSAAIVVAGNEYIAEHARVAGARHVELIPTVVDVDRYAPRERLERRPFTIGWIGSPHTAPYLEIVAEPLRALAREGAVIRLVGLERSSIDVPAVCVPWSEATEIDEIARFDVGIMPLPDSPWERGKCGYKLIQCMAMGKPVVASPVGMVSALLANGAGVLAATPTEWLEALRGLRGSESDRQARGARGRATVESKFSLTSVLPRLLGVFHAVAAR